MTWRQRLSYLAVGTYYLFGVTSVMYLVIPYLLLWTGVQPAAMRFGEFAALGGPVVVTGVALYLLSQRWLADPARERGLHWRGLSLEVACWPVYLVGTVLAVIRAQIPYIPAAKQAHRGRFLALAWPHLIVALAYLCSVAWTLYRRLVITPEGSLFLTSEAVWGMVAFATMALTMASGAVTPVGKRARSLRGCHGTGWTSTPSSSTSARPSKGQSIQNTRRSGLEMRRRHRIVLVTLVGVTSVFVVLALGLLGSASEGPISATLQRVGSGVSRLESLLVRRVRGTSKAHELGSVPLVTWEPWLRTFQNRLHPDLPPRAERELGGLAAIGRGDYDPNIDEWARQAAAYAAPVFVRLGHEMNDPYRYPWGPQNNEPQEFIDAWRRVVDRFRAAGADNVVWVWAPHVAYWSQWWGFDLIFGQHYDFLAGFGKPLMIAEFGSLAVGGDRAAWYRDAPEGFSDRFLAVKALLFFHAEGDATSTAQALDWSFTTDSSVVRAVREALTGSAPDAERGDG